MPMFNGDRTMYMHTLADWMNSGDDRAAVAFRRAYVCRLDDILCKYGPRLGGSRVRKNRLLKLQDELVAYLIEGDEMDHNTAEYICLGMDDYS